MTPMSTETQGTVQRSGRAIGWRRAGTGAPLLLLNGYAATAADWDPVFLEALEAGFDVIAPDNRGMGDSPWGDDTEPLSIGSMADDALAVVDALGLGSFALVGWSMGGFIAQTIAAEVPERIVAMGLTGTDGGGPEAVRADPEVWARLIDSTGPAREQATRLLSVLFPPELAAALDAQVGPLVAEGRAALDQQALRSQEAAMDAWHADTPPAVPTDAPPVVVACGADDIVIPAANADLLAARWHAEPAQVYPGGGHAFMAQVPEELGELLTRHLSVDRV